MRLLGALVGVAVLACCTSAQQPQDLNCGDTAQGSTVGLPDLFESSHNGRVLYSFTLPSYDATYTISTCSDDSNETTYDTYLWTFEDPELTGPIDENDDACGTQSQIEGQTGDNNSNSSSDIIFIVVGGYDTSEGDFVLSIECIPTDTASTPTPINFPETWPENWEYFPEAGAFYEWREGEAFCNDRGAHLVSVRNSDENDALSDVLRQVPVPNPYYNVRCFYLGGSSYLEPGTWRWSGSNEVFWFDGAPYGDAFSNFTSPPSGSETSPNCAFLCYDSYGNTPNSTGAANVFWDAYCYNSFAGGVVCEYGEPVVTTPPVTPNGTQCLDSSGDNWEFSYECCDFNGDCGEGEGDCDEDYHCEGHSKCGSNNCDALYPGAGYPFDADCCLPAEPLPLKDNWEYIHTPENWESAALICNERGSHLLSIEDESDNEAFAAIANITQAHCLWSGGNSLVEPGTWSWSDTGDVFFRNGESLLYTNWDSLEPYDENDGIYRRCLSAVSGLYGNPANWTGLLCDFEYCPFVCETGVPVVAPTLPTNENNTQCHDFYGDDWAFDYTCCSNADCEVGQGDCDRNQHCKGRATCGLNNCREIYGSDSGFPIDADCCVEAQPIPLPDHWELVDTTASWFDAESQCNERGQHLVSIRSEAENLMMIEAVEALYDPESDIYCVWLGGRRSINDSDTWYWVDDNSTFPQHVSSAPFTDWTDDNYFDSTNECLQAVSYGYNGSWASQYCLINCAAICEDDAPQPTATDHPAATGQPGGCSLEQLDDLRDDIASLVTAQVVAHLTTVVTDVVSASQATIIDEIKRDTINARINELHAQLAALTGFLTDAPTYHTEQPTDGPTDGHTTDLTTSTDYPSTFGPTDDQTTDATTSDYYPPTFGPTDDHTTDLTTSTDYPPTFGPTDDQTTDPTTSDYYTDTEAGTDHATVAPTV